MRDLGQRFLAGPGSARRSDGGCLLHSSVSLFLRHGALHFELALLISLQFPRLDHKRDRQTNEGKQASTQTASEGNARHTNRACAASVTFSSACVSWSYRADSAASVRRLRSRASCASASASACVEAYVSRAAFHCADAASDDAIAAALSSSARLSTSATARRISTSFCRCTAATNRARSSSFAATAAATARLSSASPSAAACATARRTARSPS